MEAERSVTMARPGSLASSRGMRDRFLREVAQKGLPAGPGPSGVVTLADLAALPPPAQRYMRFMGVPGRPRDWSFRARWTGRFRMRPDKPWMPCEAWQYNTNLPVTRIFHMRLRVAGFMPLLVRDTYVHGAGRMSARVLDSVSVVNEAGFRLDIGELVTYLNDAIMFAPSMVLGPGTAWRPVDASAFDVALTDAGRTVTARVSVDDEGAVTNFSTTDRFGADPAHPGTMVRARWTTPMEGWKLAGDRRLPMAGKAVWHFPSGDFTYADFRVAEEDLAFNVAP